MEELAALYGEEGLIVREFSYIVSQMGLNRPVEGLLADFGRRSGLEEVRKLRGGVSDGQAQRRPAWGAIMDYTAGVIRDKMQVQEDIRAATGVPQAGAERHELPPLRPSSST